MQQRYPKRLIEVDLPIKRISAHARREKSIRHGHISTLHIWWARRPLAACRAVICAALWPDPTHELCPDSFREKAREVMQQWTDQCLKLTSNESMPRFVAIQKDESRLADNAELQKALLDFIADFADWDNSTGEKYLETSQLLTQAAHEALGGMPSSRPLVVDPFAGGGSIPLESLRVGADAFASDLNPVAVLLNKVVLEYIPKYGNRLASEVRKWGEWIRQRAAKELAEFYPKDPDGNIPIAYLWARTILCEGPGCGAEVPILPSRLIEKNGKCSTWLVLDGQSRKVNVSLRHGSIAPKDLKGTAKRGSVTCPCCGHTTPVAHVRQQISSNMGGVKTARLLAVAIFNRDTKTRSYRLPELTDLNAVRKASKKVARLRETDADAFPDEALPLMSGVFNVPLYGHNTWSSLYSDRQLLLLISLCKLVKQAEVELESETDAHFSTAIVTMLSIAIGKVADYSTTICTWVQSGGFIGHTFAQGQCLPMKFDFAESVPLAGFSGSWEGAVDWGCRIIEREAGSIRQAGHAQRGSATLQFLPDESTSCFFTDPPYYNAVPYADLSDFFYVWHRRTLHRSHSDLFNMNETPKAEEICQMAGWDPARYEHKTSDFFEREIARAFSESRRVLNRSGIGVIVFAHKTTSGWESLLQAIIKSGWVVTASWPIDTERSSRLRGMKSAALGSSIHIVCRPRENRDGMTRQDDVGDWRGVLAELPKRIHEWMPRLSQEGIVGADAIFACLGPALEIFSRYSRVEKASGEQVSLRDYLEQVWAAVSKEALNMIFTGADATGFEEDSRLTAMWLWTLSTGANGTDKKVEKDAEDTSKTKKLLGYALEYDAARKIAQGLGAHLEKLTGVVEVKGDTARLLSVAERTKYLFGKDESQAPAGRRKKKDKQEKFDFAKEVEEAESKAGGWGEKTAPRAGQTILDQLHQAMILFAAGRGEAMKRFLVEEGIGRDGRFWRLAQALSALYPKNSDEKRWVDGVLARKKGLGF